MTIETTEKTKMIQLLSLEFLQNLKWKPMKRFSKGNHLYDYRIKSWKLVTLTYTIYCRREKQIEYGKNTVSYDKYIGMVPKESREDRMPRTPNKRRKYSRRQWDGMVKKWKQDIHKTVACLEGRTEEEDEAMSTGRLSSIGSWADEVEEEEISRSRMSSSSSDQVCR